MGSLLVGLHTTIRVFAFSDIEHDRDNTRSVRTGFGSVIIINGVRFATKWKVNSKGICVTNETHTHPECHNKRRGK